MTARRARLGVIVGTSGDRAVLWDANTLAIEELNTVATAALGWELTSAIDINDAGLIVGAGTVGRSLCDAFVFGHAGCPSTGWSWGVRRRC